LAKSVSEHFKNPVFNRSDSVTGYFPFCPEAFKAYGQINAHIFDAHSAVSWSMHKLGKKNLH